MDLDGTIIRPRDGDVFPTFMGDFEFIPNVLSAIKNFVYAHKTEYVFIASNQDGIDNGIITEANFSLKLSFICASLEEYVRIGEGGSKTHVKGAYCPSNDAADLNRKPNTGMLSCLIQHYALHNIPREEMLMVGDASGLEGRFSDSDKKTAENFGIDYLDISEFIKEYYLKDLLL
jgi:DNA 3'-phosphatase